MRDSTSRTPTSPHQCQRKMKAKPIENKNEIKINKLVRIVDAVQIIHRKSQSPCFSSFFFHLPYRLSFHFFFFSPNWRDANAVLTCNAGAVKINTKNCMHERTRSRTVHILLASGKWYCDLYCSCAVAVMHTRREPNPYDSHGDGLCNGVYCVHPYILLSLVCIRRIYFIENASSETNLDD